MDTRSILEVESYNFKFVNLIAESQAKKTA